VNVLFQDLQKTRWMCQLCWRVNVRPLQILFLVPARISFRTGHYWYCACVVLCAWATIEVAVRHCFFFIRPYWHSLPPTCLWKLRPKEKKPTEKKPTKNLRTTCPGFNGQADAPQQQQDQQLEAHKDAWIKRDPLMHIVEEHSREKPKLQWSQPIPTEYRELHFSLSKQARCL